MQEKKINNLVINKVENQQTYEKMKTQGLINNDELYLVGGGGEGVTGVKGNKETVFRAGNVNLTASNIGALAEDTPVIKYTEQNLDDNQKTQARTNIGAGTSSFSGQYNDLTGTPPIVYKNKSTVISSSVDIVYDSRNTLGIRINPSYRNCLLKINQRDDGFGINLGTNSTTNNGDVIINGVATPTTDNDAANKKYVDDAIANNTVDISEATTSTPGLMSATDKVKLNGIAENANNYTLPVAKSDVLGGVKSGGDFTVNSSTGVVTIKHQSLADYAKTADVNTSLNSKVPTTRKINNKALNADITLSVSDISGAVRYDIASQGLTTTQKANARTNIGAGTSSFSGNYNDLTNKPTIPSAITESTVSGWGFTKNTGTYSKPSDGIPKSDLASAIQTSLDKANTALQSLPSHTHNYAGSSSAGGAANSVKTNLTIKLNGGATEGTNLFTFNGSTAKTINITPNSIGAAASDHTHNYLPLSGGTLTGNLTGKHITGTLLQTTATSDKAGRFATIDDNGWIYYRTASEVASDIGAVTADTFVAYTETEIQTMWNKISV